MLTRADIVDELPRILAELTGLRPKAARVPRDRGADLSLTLGGRPFVIAVAPSARAGVVAGAVRQVLSAARRVGRGAVPLVATPYMGEVGQRICREQGVGYVDLSGNASITAPRLVVRVSGNPNQFVQRGRPSSVFAPKSSRVARLLLLDPQRWWVQQALAETADLGPGYVSRICGRLAADGLIERNELRAARPRDPRLLFDAWRAEYDFGKHDVVRGHVSARSGDELAARVARALEAAGVRYATTGLAAAWQLAPFAGYRLVTVYTARRADRRSLSALKWTETERGANVWLIRPRDAGVWHGSAVVHGVCCVSPVQAYLDLHSMPERSDEAAGRLREQCLSWM